MKFSLLNIFRFVLLILCIACREEESVLGVLTDRRDNTRYSTITLEGTTWMLENLRYGQAEYSYQQALYACPDGWSLPDAQDWDKLCNHFGGYINFGTTQGDPVKAYKAMVGTNGFNATADAHYWTSTPAWEDDPHIRSYGIYFESYNKQVWLESGLVTSRTYCRCIKKEKPQTDDLLSFKINGKSFRFDFYRIDSELTAHEGKLAVLIHKVLDNALYLDRCLFTVEIPQTFVTAQNPVVVTNATLNHQTLDIGWNENNFHNLQDPTFFSLTVTHYDGETIEGVFTGQTYDKLQLTDGEFHFKVKNQ